MNRSVGRPARYLGSVEWHKLVHVGTVHRAAKLGMCFEASRTAPLAAGLRELGFYHVCRTRPSTFMGGPKSSNSKGLPAFRVGAFAFSDVTPPAAPAIAAAVGL